MSYETLDFELVDGVAWITLNRQAAFNALNLQSMKELYDVANECGSSRQIRAVVLTGAGEKSFCAGGDVAAIGEQRGHDRLLKEMTTYFHSAISRFAWMDAPLIAMINGVAAGAGLSLVAAADLAVAADRARFTSAYTQIGLSPDGSSTYFLPRVIGMRRTTELYLTNRVLTAQEALEWGLVNKVVPQSSLRDAVAALAADLARGPTRAYGGVKKLLQMSTQDSLESQMEREGRQIIELCQSTDGLEGLRAFIERREPTFLGH